MKSPFYLFFVLAILTWSCQNEKTSSTTTTTDAAPMTEQKTVSMGSIPDSTKIDSNWVRSLQGHWTLASDTTFTVEISGNTYTDRKDGIIKGAFQIEYSNGCKKCQSEMDLGKNKCLVLLNEHDKTNNTCLLLSELSNQTLKVINTKYPDVVYSYSKK